MARALVAIALGAAALALACGAPQPIVGCEAGSGMEPHCGFDDPEDLLWLRGVDPGDPWLLLSEMAPMGRSQGDPGRLLAYRPSDGERRPLYPVPGADAPSAAAGDPPSGATGDPDCPGPPDPTNFAPHGIDLRADGLALAAVNHGGREAVEFFAVGPGPSLQWRGCALLPGETFGNDLVWLPDGGVVVTNMLPRDPGLMDNLRMLTGRDTGWLLHWSRAEGFREIAGSRSPTPNGVEVSATGETLYFTAWAAKKLIRVPLRGGEAESVDLGVRGDNLSWDEAGRLLVTGQDTGLSELVACTSRNEGTCAMAFSILRVDPETLAVEPLLQHDGKTVFGAASVAVEGPGGHWLGSFGADRIVFVSAR